MLQSLILIDTLFSACWEKNLKKRETARGLFSFFPGWDMPCWVSCMGFSWLLGAIKG
jgi:hypothetical protein